MSEENVELHQRANDAVNRHDIDALLALVDANVEFSSRLLEVEGGGPYRGHDGIRSWWENLLGVFPDFSSEIEEVRDLGDVTVARLLQRAQGIESDAPAVQTTWQAVKWRNGKAMWSGIFRSEAEALEAAGLSE